MTAIELIKMTAGAVIGAGLAYAFYRFIGCRTACPIVGNIWLMLAYGAVVGLALALLWR